MAIRTSTVTSITTKSTGPDRGERAPTGALFLLPSVAAMSLFGVKQTKTARARIDLDGPQTDMSDDVLL